MSRPLFAAASIADNLGLPVQVIRRLVDAGDLPTLAGGLHDQPWATWLCIGRRVGAQSRDGATASSLVAFGWLHTLGCAPAPANLQALKDVFIANGFTLADSMQAYSSAQALLEAA